MDTRTPNPNPDAQAPVDDAGAGNTEAGKVSEAEKAAIELERLGEALGGRKFKDAEDALKTIKNMNGLVGDRTISELRKKAETHDTFEALVKGYAEDQSLTPEAARKALMDLAKGSSPQKDERVDAVLQQVSELKLQLQEKDFLAEHPEAKGVMKELKALAAQTGQTISDAYESSSLKNIVARASASEEREKTGTSLNPSRRTGVPTGKVKEAIERLKTDRSGEAMDRAVAATLGLAR